MQEGRNSSGKFVKGHSGFKPKGARSNKIRKREQLLDHVINMLGESLVESLPTMPPKQVMKLYLELLKLTVPKMARIPYVPNSPANCQDKVEFEMVHTDKKIE
jgi:hypothetical protein